MQAARFHTYGSDLVIEEVPEPVAGPGQVLVKVVATAYNPVETALRLGFMQDAMPVDLPHVPGFDLAGTVVGSGEAVIGFLPIVADGAAAEYVAVDSDLLTAAPANVPLADAAALPSSALTAWQGLFELLDLRAGQRLLINGGGGAVGGYAIQLAKQAGAYVIATASARSSAAVRAAGADEVIDYTAGPVAPAPVDAVFNLARVSPSDAAALVALVKDGGKLLSATGEAPADQARGVKTLQMYARSDAKQLAAIVTQVEAGTLRIDVGTRLALASIGSAEQAAATTHGKVIIEL